MKQDFIRFLTEVFEYLSAHTALAFVFLPTQAASDQRSRSRKFVHSLPCRSDSKTSQK